ncbi:MAG: hypothetical protein JNL32_15840, partial [Candidatus Kapabacteria bacterium]|nr:hypothetical protein [Candidatus Kapabacteria bacterium]
MKTRYTLRIIALIVALAGFSASSFASQWYISPGGNNANSGTSDTQPWRDIQFAIDNGSVANGDTLNLMSGTFSELVSVSKQLLVRNYNGASVTVQAPNTATNAAVFTIASANVTVSGLTIVANGGNATVGVYALNRNNLLLTGNAITRSGTGGSYTVTSTNINETFGSAGIVFVSDNASPYESATITGNTINGTGGNFFERGAWLRGVNGTFGGATGAAGNTVRASGVDVLVQFTSGANQTIQNNTFNGAGLVIDEPFSFTGSGSGSVTVSSNTFSPVASFSQSLHIRHNYISGSSVSVTGNTFNSHTVGILSAGSRNVSIATNSFTTGVANAVHVRVNSAFSNSSGNFVQNDCAINGNAFSSTTTDGTAIELLNANVGSQSAPEFSGVTIGTSSSRNNFVYTLAKYVSMASGFSYPVNLTENNFGTSSTSPTLASSLSRAQMFEVEDKVNHKLDASSLGLATLQSGKHFVTTNSFVTGTTTSASIQRAVSAASSGDSIFVKAGTYTDQLTLANAVVIVGDDLVSNEPSTVIDAQSGTVVSASGAAAKSLSNIELRITSS